MPGISNRKFTGGSLRRPRQGKSTAADPALSTEPMRESTAKPFRKKAIGNPMRYVGGMCFMNDHK